MEFTLVKLFPVFLVIGEQNSSFGFMIKNQYFLLWSTFVIFLDVLCDAWVCYKVIS